MDFSSCGIFFLRETGNYLEEYRDRWRVKNAIVSMFEDARGNPQNLGQSMDIFFGAIKGALFDAPAEVVKTIMPDDIDAYVDKYQGLLPDAKSASGQFSQVGAQALAPTGVFNKALKGLGLANGLLRYTASGIATDFSAFDPDDANLGDIARDIGVLDNGVAEAIRSTIADSLAKNEDDGEFVKRMKNAGGGLLTQSAFDGIATSYRALRKISSQVDLQPLFDSLKKSAQSEKRFALAEQAGKVDLDASGNKLVLPDEKSAAAADEILQGARNSTAQVVDEVVDGHQVISFFDEKAPEDAFVRTKNGDVAHGYVTQELADTLGTGTAGEIRVYNSLNKHIDSVRAKAITEHGYNDLVDFVDDTVENWSKIYPGRDDSFLIVKESSKDNIIAVKLEKEHGYYKTSTVILGRKDYLKNKKPLAERAQSNQLLAKSPGAVSGTSGINNMTSNAENVKPQPTKDLLQDYDFNLKNLGTSEEMNNIISTISRQYYDDITKATIGTTPVKGRTIPNAVIDDLSTRLAVDKGRVEKLVEKFPADVEDLSIKATAMRKLLVDTTSETERMAKELANIPQEQITDEMVFKFREQITRQAAVQRKLKGAQTEIARALQSFKIAANATGAERSNAILEITQGMGGADTAVQIARGGIEADMAISRIATGSVLLGWAGYLVANDVLTGAGPEGALRKQWLENYQPYSIRIGDKWYSYQGLEPVSLSNAPRGMIARAGKMFIYVPWGNLGFFYKDHGHTPDSNLIELGEVEKGLEALAEQKGGFSAEMTVLNGDERP